MSETLTEEQERLFHKVRHLLKKAEGTPFEHEAATFLAKAQEMIAKHAIDEEVLWASEPERRQQVIVVDLDINDRSPGAAYRRLIANRVAANNRCRCWYVSGGNSTKIAGFPNDAMFCEMLFTSILVQCNFQLAHALARDHKQGNSKVYRREFVAGYAERICERLREQYDNAAQWLSQQHVSTGSAELVLADRRHKVDEWMNENVGRLTRTSVQDRGKSNIAARAAGRVSAETADISGGRGGDIKRGSRKELNA